MDISLSDIISLGSLLMMLLMFLRLTRKDKTDGQSDIDKTQTAQINTLQTNYNKHEERFIGVQERMNRIDSRQDHLETKTEKSIEKLADRIEKMPQEIVKLIKSLG